MAVEPKKRNRGKGVPFPKGNEYYKKALNRYGNLGRPHRYENSEELMADVMDYFVWVEENPLSEEKVFQSDGKVITHNSPKLRAMTLGGMCTHIGLHVTAWQQWRRSRPDLLDVIQFVDQTMQAQKFEAAAAGLMAPNFISKDLGMSDTIDANVVVEEKPMTDKELARRVAFAMRKALEGRGKQEIDEDG